MEEEDIMMMATSSPTWKLYDNPHYSGRRHHNSPKNNTSNNNSNSIAYTCISKSKRRSSYHTADLSTFSFQYPMLDRDISLSDLDSALAEIKELRSELEFERRMRIKVESLNEALTWHLSEERRLREEAEEARQRLEEEIDRARREMEAAAAEVEEERRMLRVAELMREERVQMKMSEARILMEEKIKEINDSEMESVSKNNGSDDGGSMLPIRVNENPHIKRGMKGMEFPKSVRVRVRANGFGSSPLRGSREQLGSNLECQRAQLRVLTRNKNPAGSGIVGTAESLVM